MTPDGSDDETTVVVDVHEPDDIRYLALGHPDTDGWLEHDLEAADIVVNGVGFERKTPSDYASSLLDGRLNEQIEKLKEVYDRAYILLEGGFDDFSSLPHTSINAASLRGHAASTTARHGVPVIPTGGSTGTETAQRLLVDMAIRLGRKHTETPVSDYLNASDAGSDASPATRMWAALDGIGPTRASALADRLGTPVEFMHEAMDKGLTEEELLMEVEGIGEKTAVDVAMTLWSVEDADPSDEDSTAHAPSHDGPDDASGDA